MMLLLVNNILFYVFNFSVPDREYAITVVPPLESMKFWIASENVRSRSLYVFYNAWNAVCLSYSEQDVDMVFVAIDANERPATTDTYFMDIGE